MKDKTILIADDHPMIRHGLRQTIESHEEWQIVGEADDGNEAFELICKLRPSIAILDISMPGRDGFEVVRALRQKQIETSVIFLTMYRDESFFKQALDLEVRGYVLKESAVADVVTALKTVSQGEHYTSPALTSYLIRSRTARPAAPEQGLGVHLLSPTERRVLELIAEYKTSKDIAEELSTSPRTVETHRTNIAQKLGLHGRHALMKFALEHKSSE
ncbi:MAG TPA: response regulator transcription factor [Pyrinomonadaceae bacterium]|nr:response regulator transcription factor [Pyrinomonadaceae bacterium]